MNVSPNVNPTTASVEPALTAEILAEALPYIQRFFD
jgi:hypothetical protein